MQFSYLVRKSLSFKAIVIGAGRYLDFKTKTLGTQDWPSFLSIVDYYPKPNFKETMDNVVIHICLML